MSFENRFAKLMKVASARKDAFVPVQGGGAPPMDPSQAGGAPPMDPSMGGAPPADPSQMGGAPLPTMDPNATMAVGDPSMGGAAPPPGPPPAPVSGGGGDPMAGMGDAIRSAVQDALGQAGMKGSGNPKQPKPDINTIATDVFQIKKLILHDMKLRGVEIPMDILDGPNRDPITGAPAVSPTGGSDVAPGASMAQAGMAPPPGGDVSKSASDGMGAPIHLPHHENRTARLANLYKRCSGRL